MRWIELNGKKDPPFDQKILISIQNHWHEAELKKIETTLTGTYYTFCKTGDSEVEYMNASHFAIPEPPKTDK